MWYLDDPDFKKAVQTFKLHSAEAQKQHDELMHALEMQDLVDSASNKKLFQERADRALLAYDNWTRSAELARTVAQEIASGLKRPLD